MAREPTDTVAWMKNRWHARLSVKDPDGNRWCPRSDLRQHDVPNTLTGKAKAKRLAAQYAELGCERAGMFVGELLPHTPKEPEPVAEANVETLTTRWLEMLDEYPGDLAPSTIYGY